MGIKFNTESYSNEVYKINPEYKLISEYINIKTKVTLLHLTCNHSFDILPYNFKQGHGCPFCFGNKSKQLKAKEKFINLINATKDYILVSDYISSREYVKIKHTVCGNEYEVTPTNFLAGRRCPKCNFINNKLRKTNETFLDEIHKIYGEEYIPLEKYINSKTKIKVLHSICKNTWKVRPDDLLRGFGCPKCQQSKGEQKIAKWLNDKNYDYETQYTFNDLFYKNNNSLLRFDFKLSCEDGSLILIEYDGIQHFKQNCFNNTKKDFEEIKKRDNLKNEYCKKNNIALYRITYKDFNNIPKVLNEIFSEYE